MLKWTSWSALLLSLVALAGCGSDSVTGVVPPPPTVTFQLLNIEPAWSPDSLAVAFTHVVYDVVPDSAAQVWIFDLRTSAARLVTLGSSPAWAPNSGALCFERRGDIYTLDLSSNVETRITQVGECRDPAWDPTGDRIAYSVLPNGLDIDIHNSGIWVTTLSTSESKRVTEAGAQMAAWAPDGEALAFARFEGTAVRNYEISTIRLADSTVSQITSNVTDDVSPTWNRSGDALYWANLPVPDRSSGSIWTRDPMNASPAQLLEYGRHPSLSPDGLFLLCAAPDTSSKKVDIWCVELASRAARLLLGGGVPTNKGALPRSRPPGSPGGD